MYTHSSIFFPNNSYFMLFITIVFITKRTWNTWSKMLQERLLDKTKNISFYSYSTGILTIFIDFESYETSISALFPDHERYKNKDGTFTHCHNLTSTKKVLPRWTEWERRSALLTPLLAPFVNTGESIVSRSLIKLAFKRSGNTETVKRSVALFCKSLSTVVTFSIAKEKISIFENVCEIHTAIFDISPFVEIDIGCSRFRIELS